MSKASLVSSPSGRLGDFSDDQKLAYEQFLEKLNATSEDEEEEKVKGFMFEAFGGKEYCAWRFLKGRDFSVEKAHAMFSNTLKWRKDNQVHRVFDDHFSLFEEALPLWSGGFHKAAVNGCPTVIMRVGKISPSKLLEKFSLPQLTNFYIFWMEYALYLQKEGLKEKLQRLQDGQEPICHGIVEIYDLSGLSFSQLNLSALNTLSSILKIGQEHYPENLFKGFIVNAPTVFSATWKILKPILHANTQAKISVTSNSNLERLEPLLGAPNIPTFMGGSDTTFPAFPPKKEELSREDLSLGSV